MNLTTNQKAMLEQIYTMQPVSMFRLGVDRAALQTFNSLYTHGLIRVCGVGLVGSQYQLTDAGQREVAK